MLAAGVPPVSIPAWSTAQEFWSRVVDQVQNGLTTGGVLLLAREAAMRFPGNAELARLAAGSAREAEARDLMAPNTEPTDAELALVMNAAWDLAMERQARSDAWVKARLEEAARFGREQSHASVIRRGGKGS